MNTESRLASLERSNRRLRLALVAIVIVGVGAVAVGFSAAPPKSITTTELVVVDSNGKAGVRITGDDGGMISVYNADHKMAVAILSGDNKCGTVSVLDQTGDGILATLGTNVEGTGGMVSTNYGDHCSAFFTHRDGTIHLRSRGGYGLSCSPPSSDGAEVKP